MNCYYHENNLANYECTGCGKPLCTECANLVQPPMCGNCIDGCRETAIKEMTKSILFGIIIAIACCALMQESSGIFFFCVPFGWYALNKITPKVFLFLPIGGWVLYFAIKFVLAAFIGWVAVVIKMYQWIKTICIANKVM